MRLLGGLDSYVGWARVAMGGYGVTAIFLRVAMRSISVEITLLIANLMLVAAGVALAVFRSETVVAHHQGS